MTTAPVDRLLLGVTGAIAATIVPSAISWMRSVAGISQIRVVLTEDAAAMVPPRIVGLLAGSKALVHWSDCEDYDSVPHVALGRWAEAFLIFPATANVLAKAALGIADDLLTTCIVAAECPVIFAPSMNAAMWRKPATQRNAAQVVADGYHLIPPTSGYELAGNRTSFGSPRPVGEIMECVAAIVRGNAAHGATA